MGGKGWRSRAEVERFYAMNKQDTQENKMETRQDSFTSDLYLQGKATDHIWLMEDVEGYIGIRMDSGDSGVVYLTREQAADLSEQLAKFISAA